MTGRTFDPFAQPSRAPAVAALDVSAGLAPYRLSICGLAELEAYADVGITHVLSILDPDHPEPSCFSEYAPHRRVTVRYHDIIGEIGGHVVPTRRDVQEILELGRTLPTEDADHVLIHCHMGISRSTASAAMILAQDNPGREDDIFAQIAQIRPKSWPNSRMVGYADDILGYEGRLVAAMRRHYLTIGRQHPEFTEFLGGTHRRTEVPPELLHAPTG